MYCMYVCMYVWTEFECYSELISTDQSNDFQYTSTLTVSVVYKENIHTVSYSTLQCTIQYLI